MSNMIKAYSVRYDEDYKKTIDTHLRIDKEIEQKKRMIFTSSKDTEEFTQGIKAVIVEQLPSIEEQREMSAKIAEDAKKEAKQILDQAKQDAEKMKADAYAAAQKKGYEEGMQQSSRQTQKLAAEYEAKTKKLQKEYEASVAELEPRMVEIVSALLEKLTGVVAEDNQEVILYLVDKALKNMDKSSEYTIKVSKEDCEFLLERKSDLLNAIGRNVSLYIVEDAGMIRNQCLIETDSHVIDCSLDVQLSNLITDLKILGRV